MAKKKNIKLSVLAKRGIKAVKDRKSKEDRELEKLRRQVAAKKTKETATKTAAKQKADKLAEIKKLKEELAKK